MNPLSGTVVNVDWFPVVGDPNSGTVNGQLVVDDTETTLYAYDKFYGRLVKMAIDDHVPRLVLNGGPTGDQWRTRPIINEGGTAIMIWRRDYSDSYIVDLASPSWVNNGPLLFDDDTAFTGVGQQENVFVKIGTRTCCNRNAPLTRQPD